MSTLRPELPPNSWGRPALTREATLRMLYKAVAKRRSLARGKLHVGEKSCAIGCLEDDLRGKDSVTIKTLVIDEIAAANDKLPKSAAPSRRWKYFMKWLRKELALYDDQKPKVDNVLVPVK